ncbi:MAG: hypothetical protein MPJ79_00845 [Alphaproteobacteria bacterium]|nr:hypothetical protein [Alphaproteobacteria bacterium]MDA7988738.1 hypothetical protein [Alphaproteobacteria bacterium]MDA8030286.1 hypothetical protein [Alphaproteobacteria bacterium]
MKQPPPLKVSLAVIAVSVASATFVIWSMKFLAESDQAIVDYDNASWCVQKSQSLAAGAERANISKREYYARGADADALDAKCRELGISVFD